MPSSKDPAATQEFRISALPPEAAEDSDLISALAKLVNEVDASAEDGLWTESWVTVQANSVCQPAAPSHRGISIGRNLPDSASRSMRLGMQHYAASQRFSCTTPAKRKEMKW